MSPWEWDAVYEAYKYAQKHGYHVDHIDPISGTGYHVWDNLQILDANDNLVKGAKTDIQGIVPKRTTYLVQGPLTEQDWVKYNKKNKNLEDSQSLLQNAGKLPSSADSVGNVVTNNPITRGLGITNEGRLASVVENMTDLAKGIPPGARFGMSLLPGIGILGDTADAAVKLEEAQAPDASWLDKAQSAVAGTVATTSVIPTPSAQAYNFVAGLGLGASDVIEHYGEEIWRHLGTVKHHLKGFYK